jgi:hypothetical protein
MESGRFSPPHLEQTLDKGFSSVGRPQREQNFAFGVRFFPQWAHSAKTNLLVPALGTELGIGGKGTPALGAGKGFLRGPARFGGAKY